MIELIMTDYYLLIPNLAKTVLQFFLHKMYNQHNNFFNIFCMCVLRFSFLFNPISFVFSVGCYGHCLTVYSGDVGCCPLISKLLLPPDLVHADLDCQGHRSQAHAHCIHNERSLTKQQKIL